MTGDQQKAFDALVEARAKFAPLPQKDVRDPCLGPLEHGAMVSEQRSSTPCQQAARYLRRLERRRGSRSGGMVSRQQQNLKQDGAETLAETGFLMTLLWVLLGVGIGIAATVVYLTNRSIVPPILNMVGAMGQLAGGDHSVVIPATDKKDEIGLMARAV
jgi:methyl-accepting chemotaxis protein